MTAGIWAGFPAPPAWTEQALCAQVDPDLWFPEKGGSTWAAKRICARCPVRLPCAEAGRNERHGVWGGLAPRQRGYDADGEWSHVQPCGTEAAYMRHRRHGEPPCESCRLAYNRITRERAARRGRPLPVSPEWDGQPAYEHRREEWAS